MLHLRIQAKSKGSAALLSAISEDGCKWFSIPGDLQEIAGHSELMKLPKVKRAADDCEKSAKCLKIKVKQSDELKSVYYDQDGDLAYSGHNLEEFRQVEGRDSALEELLKQLLINGSEDEKKKERIKMKDLKKLFLIEKYESKSNAVHWMERFEKECSRLDIADEWRSEALKLCIDDNLSDWFAGNTVKHERSDWKVWKKSFVDTYTNKGWSNIVSAHEFKYLGGSLIEYANAKERKLLDADKDMYEKLRVYLIICGMPAELACEFDGDPVTFAGLINELKEIDKKVMNRKPGAKKRAAADEIDKRLAAKMFEKKKPCGFCEMIGYKGNFHRLEDCKNKAKYETAKREVNFIESEGNIDDSTESDLEDQTDGSNSN